MQILRLPAVLMLLTINGQPAVVDPNYIVGVWHSNGKDFVALAAGVKVQVMDSSKAISDWLDLVPATVTLPVDKVCK